MWWALTREFIPIRYLLIEEYKTKKKARVAKIILLIQFPLIMPNFSFNNAIFCSLSNNPNNEKRGHSKEINKP